MHCLSWKNKQTNHFYFLSRSQNLHFLPDSTPLEQRSWISTITLTRVFFIHRNQYFYFSADCGYFHRHCFRPTLLHTIILMCISRKEKQHRHKWWMSLKTVISSPDRFCSSASASGTWLPCWKHPRLQDLPSALLQPEGERQPLDHTTFYSDSRLHSSDWLQTVKITTPPKL